ncbi:MAG TPA: glycosyltransferase, partial [Candidatus Binatus sp.]|nr:glycosyltransferase [Candidatus Binatus sp.]
MKICVVHNAYGKLSGEEVAVQNLSRYLREKGHSVVEFFRDSATIPDSGTAKAGALLSGIYSFSARREFSHLLDAERPDVVHVNNLYPLISTSILDESKRRRIPTVMTLHNYRLACPTGLMMSQGEVCRRCVTD